LVKRLRNLIRAARRQGWLLLQAKLASVIDQCLNRLSSTVLPGRQVDSLLRSSFPERLFTFQDFQERFQIPTYKVKNLNSPEAVAVLQGLAPDLGVVLGTRILKRPTFSVPRMGSINLHKGKVPNYRGMPAGFWELYNGETEAGVTVHFVDDGLDTGDVVAEGVVSIHAKDTHATLLKKLHDVGSDILQQAVTEIARGNVTRKPQVRGSSKPHTSPSLRQTLELSRRRAFQSNETWLYRIKTTYYLVLYYSGFVFFNRFLRKALGRNRVCVLLYHRVNDLAEDSLTISTRRFAEHLWVLAQHYTVISTDDLLSMLGSGKRLPPNCIVIHFDDCYRDVYTNAARMLKVLSLPACCFVASGFVGTQRRFGHDEEKCPFVLENLSAHDIAGFVDEAFEIGAHTVNHVDLGRCSSAQAQHEITESRGVLERLTGKRVDLFSYPFGREMNIRDEVVELIRQAGYRALFAAHGGYVTPECDLFNIPRVGMSGEFRALDLLMEVEGLSFGACARSVKAKTKVWASRQIRGNVGKGVSI